MGARQREYTVVYPDDSFDPPMRDSLAQDTIAQVPTLHLIALFHPWPAHNHRRTISLSGRETVALTIIHDTGHLAGLAWSGSLPLWLRERWLFEFGWGGGMDRGMWCTTWKVSRDKVNKRWPLRWQQQLQNVVPFAATCQQ